MMLAAAIAPHACFTLWTGPRMVFHKFLVLVRITNFFASYFFFGDEAVVELYMKTGNGLMTMLLVTIRQVRHEVLLLEQLLGTVGSATFALERR